jgi:hypothetical protein
MTTACPQLASESPGGVPSWEIPRQDIRIKNLSLKRRGAVPGNMLFIDDFSLLEKVE